MKRKKVYLIGIGPGDPKYLTLEAVDLIKGINTFILPLKKWKKEELTSVRERIISFCKGDDKEFRVIKLEFPERKKGIEYREEVKKWRDLKAKMLVEALREVEEAGFLVLGDPSLYDGHVEIFQKVKEYLPIDIEVVPGISSLSLLSAKHQISLTKIAESLLITTPRQLRKMKEISVNTVVFLDNYETFKLFKENDSLKIYWGAYLGTDKEVLYSGSLSQCWKELIKLRRKLKDKYGFLMETYLLRKERENE